MGLAPGVSTYAPAESFIACAWSESDWRAVTSNAVLGRDVKSLLFGAGYCMDAIGSIVGRSKQMNSWLAARLAQKYQLSKLQSVPHQSRLA